ncbi:MAG: hypothetical protein NVS1B4_16400 [Gemmatimonadaceae bacterium]
MFAPALALLMLMQQPSSVDTVRPTAPSIGSVDGSDTSRRRGRRPRLPPRRRPVTPELAASAFASDGARALFLRAQRARTQQDSALQAYDVTAYQRISAGIRFARIGRERLLYRSESASRVRWRRGAPTEIDILGSREASPSVPGIIGDGSGSRGGDPGIRATPIPYYPGREGIWIGTDRIQLEVNDREIVHPLAVGAEAYYTYALGDSVAIRLPGGRKVDVVELLVRPREPKWNVVVGALWFDRATAQLVRAVYRLAETMDLLGVAREQGESDVDSIPLLVKPLITPMRADLHSVTIEYGLYKERFWLPRLQAAEGQAQVSFMRVPFRVEDRFDYGEVRGAGDSLPRGPADSVTALRTDTTGASIAEDARDRRGDWAADSTANGPDTQPGSRERARAARRVRRDSVVADRKRRRAIQCARSGSYTIMRRVADSVSARVRVPCDTAKLAHSDALPPSIYDSGADLFGEDEIAELRKTLSLSLQPVWAPGRVSLEFSLADGSLRYNRVEGLSAGLGARLPLGGGLVARASARIGLADREPNAEVMVARSEGVRTVALGAYRRLAVASDWGNPLSFSSSMSALLFGRDEGFYYRAAGVELTATTESDAPVELRVFGERDDRAPVRTNVALSHAISGGTFLPNIDAQPGTIVGTSLRRRATWGLDPTAFRLLTDTRAEVGVGTFAYGRAAVDVTASRGLGSRGAIAVTGGAGTSGGVLPVQRQWFLGGAQTVRGEPAGAQSGDAYWLARIEIGAGSVAARPVVFYDAGWAGDRNAWTRQGGALRGTGVGASFGDGLVRIDLARGLAPVRQWRVDLYVESRF